MMAMLACKQSSQNSHAASCYKVRINHQLKWIQGTVPTLLALIPQQVAMFPERLMWLIMLPAILLNVSSAQTKSEVKCEADWPHASLERCPFEGEEFRPRPDGSGIAHRALLDFNTVTLFEDDGNLGKVAPKENRTTPFLDTEIEPEYTKDDVSYPKRDPTEEPAPTKGLCSSEEPVPTKEPAPTGEPVPPDAPAWPTKWTKRPCCQLTCACYKFLTAPEFGTPKKMSEAWKKQMCCYGQMLDDPHCANPPSFERRFDVVPPPWCLV